MRKFLLATDLSAEAGHALARAARLARQHGAELRVLHVVDDPLLPPRFAEAQRAAAERILAERLQALTGGETAPGSISVVKGKPFAEILREAASWQPDLIVVGAHHPDLLPDMLRGTTAERVIRLGHVPVLLAKWETGKDRYRRAVVGMDFSLHALRAAQCGFRLAPEAEFHLVHAFAAPSPAFLHGEATRAQAVEAAVREMRRAVGEEVAALLARFGEEAPRVERIVAEGVAQDVLAREAQRLRADLLVLGTHGRTGVAHAFLGSVAEDLLRRAPCDVLVAKAW